MNETITLAEAILVSMLTVIVWVVGKTILQMIEEKSKNNKPQNF